jgi:tetratricopeptide (TPR) repeat protein
MTTTSTTKKLGGLLAIMLLSGCASQMHSNGGAPVEDSGTSVRVPGMDAPPRPERDDRQPNSSDTQQDRQHNSGWRVLEPEEPEPQAQAGPNSAVASLLSQGRAHYQSGAYRRAIASAERALRIDRRNPAVYLLLAENYQRLGNRGQAEQFAQQGLRYSRDDRTLQAALRGVLNAL